MLQRVGQKGQLHIAYLWEEAVLAEGCCCWRSPSCFLPKGRYLELGPRPDRRPLQTGRRAGPAAALRSLLRKELLAEQNGRIELRIELLRYWMEQNSSVVDETWLTP